jgi:ubiquinone/menaquinone biosynthesis C-methylase UbiE
MDAPNAQFNLTLPNSRVSRVIDRARRRMFERFMAEVAPAPSETVLDIGVTSDQTYVFSNYFEAMYPWKDRITATGLDDARFLETQHPGVKFRFADVLDLPFSDKNFDIVHAAAVIEHVGSYERQARMVAECLRVARRAVYLTTPNRWFPIEFHTQLPLVHWLPTPISRAVMRNTGYGFFANEENLNLMSRSRLARIMAAHPAWRFHFVPTRLFGWTSNLVLIAVHRDAASG